MEPGADETRTVPTERDPSRRPAAVLVASTAGHVIEHYDYNTFGVMTIFIAPLFFPNGSQLTAVLSMLAVFAVPFIARPLGGVLFGIIGDRWGRRRCLVLTISLMGVSSGLIGALPTAQSIGPWAAVLLVVLRLVQTMSAGGETSGSTTYVIESAPPGKRGLFGGILGEGPAAGLGLASAAVLGLTSFLTPEQIGSWGWRIPFLVSLPLAAVALYIRLRLEETTAFVRSRDGRATSSPLRTAVTRDRTAVLQVFGLCLIQSVGGYLVTIYAITYLTTHAGYPRSTAALLTTIGIVVGLVYTPLVGALSDRIGRKPLVAAAQIGFVVLSVPSLLVLGQSAGSFWTALVAFLVLTAPAYVLFGVNFTLCAELIPTDARLTGMSLGFNVAVILGGLSPFVSSALIGLLSDPLIPAYLVVAAGVCSLVVLRRVPETAKADLVG